jgi:hypothetical protein
MEPVAYGKWQVHPEVVEGQPAAVPKGERIPQPRPLPDTALWKNMTTKHEGAILYHRYWNFWVRAGVNADTRSTLFFRDYEKANADSDKLLRDIGFPGKKAETEEEVWSRITMVWNWMKDHVQDNNAEYGTISSVAGEWPSILDYARYYTAHGNLVWAACFSKAHLFATLLGRMAYPRYRFAIAEGHHTEGGAPPTASHVFVAAYVNNRWLYLDPTAVRMKTLPDFGHLASVGVPGFATVDYEHPYTLIPVPLSGFDRVPNLPP